MVKGVARGEKKELDEEDLKRSSREKGEEGRKGVARGSSGFSKMYSAFHDLVSVADVYRNHVA